MAITVVKGYLLTKAKFINKDSEKYSDMGLDVDSSEFDDFRIKVSEITAWNNSDDAGCTTLRTRYDSFVVAETIEDIDILMLSGKL
tara:strand:+ start:322 stop:579 length:258 start_codon:yes stop_codon:yes gene_type:complete